LAGQGHLGCRVYVESPHFVFKKLSNSHGFTTTLKTRQTIFIDIKRHQKGLRSLERNSRGVIKSLLQSNIPRTSPNEDSELPSGDRPSLLNDIPNSEVLIPNANSERDSLALLNHDLLEPAEDLGGLMCVYGKPDVKLGDFGAVHETCVKDIEADVEGVVVDEGVTTDSAGGDDDRACGEGEGGRS
jgi:hypothetical protein